MHCAFRGFGLVEQRGGEVPLCGVRQDCDHGFALAQLFGKLQGGGYIGAAADAAHDALFGCQVLGYLQGFFVLDNANIVVNALIQDLGNHTVTDTHLHMGADGTAGQNRRILRLYCPNGQSL